MQQTRKIRRSVLALIMVGVVAVTAVLVIAVLLADNQQARSMAQPFGPAATSSPVVRSAPATLTPTLKSVVAVIRPTATVLPTVTPSPTPTQPFFGEPETIGTSVQGRPLIVYRLGRGPIKRAFIGAIHGGYEWNTTELMTRTLDYLREHPEVIPPEITLYILPLANPDGYAAGTDRVTGRLNANLVDLNRNWDYQWQMTATHGTQPVSAGSKPFSEPETRALRDFIMSQQLDAVVFYHSAFSAVFQGAGITTSQTVDLAQLMAQATGYRYAPEGVPGQITTGDSIDWLTANGITAIEVELSTHQALDWEQNLRGLEAFLNWGLSRSTPTRMARPPNSRSGAFPTYVTQPGDTLWTIANQFNVTVEELARANQMNTDDILPVGKTLIIP